MKIASKEFVIKKMSELMITPKKKFSQNFLTDYPTVVEAIDALEIEDDDVIIEIVHAFKDIIIEFINKRYVNHN